MTVCQYFSSNLQCRHRVAISPNDSAGTFDDGIRRGGFEIFIYERVDGGAGLLKQVYDNITGQWEEHIIAVQFLKMKKILAGEKCLETTNEFGDNKFRTVARPCDSICRDAYRDFTTQHMQRLPAIGHQFFERLENQRHLIITTPC